MAAGFACDGELDDLRSRGEQAVPELVRRYQDKLLRMIALRLDSRVISKVGIEDVLQEVFVQAVLRARRYLDQPTVPILVWLRQITSQVLIDVHRRYLGARMRNVQREIDLDWGGFADASSGPLAVQLADSLTTPSQCAVRGEAVAAVKTVLEKLDPLDRDVLVLRHLEELSNNEVAQVLGIDRFAASKRYLRALARLRSVMPAEG